MKKFRSILLITLAFFLCISLHGQEPITLKKAVEETLENNFGIRLARENIEQLDNSFSAGKAGMLPVVDVGASYNKALGDFDTHAYTGQSIHSKGVSSNMTDVWINLHWTLFDGMKMFAEYNRLEKIKETGEQMLKIEMEQTISDLIIAYSTVIKEKQELDVLKERYELSKFRYDIANRSFEVGRSPEIEKLQAEVEMRADSSAIISQKSIYLSAVDTINEIMGGTAYKEFTDELELLDLAGLNELEQRSLENNNRLLLEKQLLEVKQLEVSKSGADFLPKLDFDAGYFFSETDAEAAFIHYNRFLGPKLALTLKYNVFNGFNSAIDYENAEIELAKQRINEQDLELRIKTVLSQFWNHYISYRDQMEYERQNIKLSEKNLDIARKSYEVGTISSLDFKDAQQKHIETKIRLIEATHYAKYYETKLLMISGELLNIAY
jgi:outer membrane protein